MNYDHQRNLIEARKEAQRMLGLSAAAAQAWCAAQVCVSPRTWRSWEYGERRIRPCILDILRMRAERIGIDLFSGGKNE